MDRSTTYCYYISAPYSDTNLSTDDVLVQDSGSLCPITTRVDIADELEKNALIPLRYTATLDTSTSDPNFSFPLPIQRSIVPNNMLGNSNMANSSDGSTMFDIAVANVVICDWRSCDLFSTANESSTYYSSMNNPINFNANIAVFSSQELAIPKDGKYTGYIHLVVSLSSNTRADFVTYFPVHIGDVAGTTPNSISTDGETTYCWTAKDVSVFDLGVSGDLTIRTNEYCPGTMSMSLSSTEVNVGDTIDIGWMLDMSESSTDDSTLIAEVSTTDAIRNPRTNIYSVVPISVFSGCQRNLAGANCSTYTGDDSSTFAIAEYDDMNFTNNIVSYSTRYTFNTSGQFTMFGRVAMVTVDNNRIDMAIYSSVTVSVEGGSGDSFVFLYIGVGIGAIILLTGMLFCHIKKRQHKTSMKDIPFRQPVRGLERPSNYTLASSNYMFNMPTQQTQGFDLSGDYGNTTALSYLAVNTADSGVFDKTICAKPIHASESVENNGSFSLNPYDRASFANLSDDIGSSQPCDTGKFSFHSNFDNESEWEFDTRQSRDSSSDDRADSRTSLPNFGGHEMGRGMPVLEENDLNERHDFQNDQQHLANSTTGLGSTSSTGWTVN